MDVASQITLDKFNLRPYQRPIWDAIENKGYKKVLVILPRRAGKDITLWNLAIRQCLRKVCLVHYVLPTYGQANRAIFSAISSTGDRFIDYIPPKLIKSINSSEMKVVFKNNSVLQCVAGDSHNTSIRGTNPYMVILSEYAYMDADVYNTVSPILAGNGGIVVMASTPYGKNHFWLQYEVAKEIPDWFVYHKTVEDTRHISEEELENERARMSSELFEQEYMCSFERGVSGAIFGSCLTELKKNNQITTVPYDPGLLVYCAFDIGIDDYTAMIWYQVAGEGSVIKIIDCYLNRNASIDHYIEKLREKPYWNRMGKIFFPHDIEVRDQFDRNISRKQKAIDLGLENIFTLPQTDREQSIENTMMMFPRFWIDSVKCKTLIDAVENYHRKWDDKMQRYSRDPVKNWTTDMCDALRYLAQSIKYCTTGMTAEEFNRKKNEALYGNRGNLPPQFIRPKQSYYR